MSRTMEEDSKAYWAGFKAEARRCHCHLCTVRRAEEVLAVAEKPAAWRDVSGGLHVNTLPGGMMVHSINCSMARRGGLCDCGVQVATDQLRKRAAQDAWNEHLSAQIAAGEKLMEYVRDHPEAMPDFREAVDHPAHYTAHPSGVECITVTEHMNFCRGNAMKYLWRAGEKGDEIEDLRKARWYLDREIQRLEDAQ